MDALVSLLQTYGFPGVVVAVSFLANAAQYKRNNDLTDALQTINSKVGDALAASTNAQNRVADLLADRRETGRGR